MSDEPLEPEEDDAFPDRDDGERAWWWADSDDDEYDYVGPDERFDCS